MRCSDCSKFVSFDTENEPEIDIDVDNEGMVTGNVRIVNNCAECSTELKEATFDLEVDFTEEVAAHMEKKELKGKEKKEHTLSIDSEGSRTDRGEGKGRYRKQFYGAEVKVTLKCNCEVDPLDLEQTWADDMQASHMEELG